MSLQVEERGTFFIPRPDDGDNPYLQFRLAEEWYAIDGDKLILPIVALEKNGTEIQEGTGLLTQYGGSELLLQMATSSQEMKQGSVWHMSYRDSFGFVIEAATGDS